MELVPDKDEIEPSFFIVPPFRKTLSNVIPKSKKSTNSIFIGEISDTSYKSVSDEPEAGISIDLGAVTGEFSPGESTGCSTSSVFKPKLKKKKRKRKTTEGSVST